MPKGKGPRPFRPGAECWFIQGPGVWFRCKIVSRTQSPDKIVIGSVTGFSHHGQVPWPHPDGLTFSPGSQLYKRLRPITVNPI